MYALNGVGGPRVGFHVGRDRAVDGAPAYDYEGAIAQLRFLRAQELRRFAHALERSGDQSRTAHEIGPEPLRSLQEFFLGHVHTDVDHLKPITQGGRLENALAYVVDVAGNRAEENQPRRFPFWDHLVEALDDLHYLLEELASHYQGRKGVVPSLVPLADYPQRMLAG